MLTGWGVKRALLSLLLVGVMSLTAGLGPADAAKGHRHLPALRSRLSVLLAGAERDARQHRSLPPKEARKIRRIVRRLRHVRGHLPAGCLASLAAAARTARDHGNAARLLAEARAALAHLATCPEHAPVAPVEHGVPTETPTEATEPPEPPKPPEEKPVLPPPTPAPEGIKPVRAIVETYEEHAHVLANHVDNNHTDFGGYNDGILRQSSPLGPGGPSTCSGLVCEVPLEANLAFTRKGEVHTGTEGGCHINYGHTEPPEAVEVGVLRLEYDDDSDLIAASLQAAPQQLGYSFDVGGFLWLNEEWARGGIAEGEVESGEHDPDEGCGMAEAELESSEWSVARSLDPGLLSAGVPAPVEFVKSGTAPPKPTIIGPAGEKIYSAETEETTLEYEFSLKASIRLVPDE